MVWLAKEHKRSAATLEAMIADVYEAAERGQVHHPRGCLEAKISAPPKFHEKLDEEKDRRRLEQDRIERLKLRDDLQREALEDLNEKHMLERPEYQTALELANQRRAKGSLLMFVKGMLDLPSGARLEAVVQEAHEAIPIPSDPTITKFLKFVAERLG